MSPRQPDHHLVHKSRAAIAKGSKSFALASSLFDRETRERAWLLYAWCRHCDDVIDAQIGGHGHVEPTDDIDTRLANIEGLTRRAIAGEETGDWPFDALGQVTKATRMPARYPLELIAGFAMDARDRTYRSFEDTLDYCYHVAGVVGVMMAIVMGVDPDDRPTLDRASDLGIAFQLNNIVRDIHDDARIGRCYLPDDWLTAADIPPGEFDKPMFARELADVVARMVGEAERYALSARYGTPALSFRSAWAVLSAADIYAGIGREVRHLGPDAWRTRVSTPKAAKLAAVAKALPQAMARHGLYADPTARDGLWTMP
ncbi:phytoene/squalene synthase family protein [Sphingoaurantiacus capsulatus]|uniref:Phytoene/squalene synthase family protein n=1 Tax=Sphingoaurantiacus capsulatus TaxID=1771310 RepID=A0ABV7XFG3_9SPHN